MESQEQKFPVIEQEGNMPVEELYVPPTVAHTAVYGNEQEMIVAIAQIVHQSNKAYCDSIGDYSQVDWQFAPHWQIETMIKGIEFVLENPTAPASANHDAWMQEKLNDGWKYGEEKNPALKTHPCLVSYEQLPLKERLKNDILLGIVKAMAPQYFFK